MWANTVWGFLGLASACLLTALGISDPTLKRELFGATGAFGAVGLIILASPAVWRWLRSLLTSPALEIVFDPTDRARRFWSMESVPHATENRHVPYWETRIEVKNNSSKTLRNVKVSVAAIGEMPSRPNWAIFDTSKKQVADINPGCSELVPIIKWPHPRAQPGMPAGRSAVAYGPLEIIATADDTPPAKRLFNFDFQNDPMIYD